MLDPTMTGLNKPDSTTSDFSIPDLAMVDLSTPGFSMLDVSMPDPALPDLTIPDIPADLDGLNVNRPDPYLPDLIMPVIPGEVMMPDSNEHGESKPQYMPEVTMEDRPGELASPALSLVRDSPDYQQLPPGLIYPKLYTSQQDMRTRDRHLGMLELGLLAQEKDER